MGRVHASLSLARRIICVALVVAAAGGGTRAGDDLWDLWAADEIGQGLGEQIGGAIRSAAELRESIAAANADLAAKRRAFWASFPNKGGHAAARAEFAAALLGKDLFYMGIFVPEGPYSRRAQMMLRLGDKFDDGIPGFARAAFDDWIIAIREGYGARDHGSLSTGTDGRLVTMAPGRLDEVMQACSNKYQIYKLLRDWSEYRSSGNESAYYDSPQAFLSFWMLQAHGQSDAAEVEAALRAMIRLFGRTPLRAAADRLKVAEKTPGGTLKDGGALGIKTYSGSIFQAILELLAREDARGTLIKSVWQGSTRDFNRIDFDSVEDRIKVLVHLYGKGQLLELAERVRAAPRGTRKIEGIGDTYDFDFFTIDSKEYRSEGEAFFVLLAGLPLRGDLDAGLAARLRATGVINPGGIDGYLKIAEAEPIDRSPVFEIEGDPESIALSQDIGAGGGRSNVILFLGLLGVVVASAFWLTRRHRLVRRCLAVIGRRRGEPQLMGDVESPSAAPPIESINQPQVPPSDTATDPQWFYQIDGRKLGPFSPQQLIELARQSRIQPTTPVWREGLKGWVKARRVRQLFPDPETE